jgi:NAD(P)-dependent dehydrogenase (short-subunit alcohol dehydrogenase family)
MRNILITGVGSGIGQALAEEYIKRGDNVFGVGRSPAKSIISNPNFYFNYIDFSEPSLILDDMRSFVSGHHFDLVILNAGTYSYISKLVETTQEQMINALNINVLSVKQVIDAVLTHAKADQIIALSTDPANFNYRGFGAHMISKAALNSLIRSYAEEYPDIQFNALAPELIQTPTLNTLLKIHSIDRYPYIQKIRNSVMMPLDQATPQLIDSFNEAKRAINGSFVEMKKLKKQGVRLI